MDSLALPTTLEPLRRILDAAFARYLERGNLTGNLRVLSLTQEERLAVTGLLGGPITTRPGQTLTMQVRQLDAALTRRGYPSVSDLGPFLGRPDARTKRLTRMDATELHATWMSQLMTRSETMPGPGGRWLRLAANGQGTAAAIIQREYRAAEGNLSQLLSLQSDLIAVATTLEKLPIYRGDSERLQLLAETQTGSPHGFDPRVRTGRLLRRALVDTVGPEAGIITVPSTTLEDTALLAAAGLIGDGISSTVATLGLINAARSDGTLDPVVSAAYAEGVPLLVPLRQVEQWVKVSLESVRVFVVENPPVFEALLDQFEGSARMPTLICGSGYPSAAAVRVLDLVVAEGATIWYGGDFDFAGLSIARALWRRYGVALQLWGMAPADYYIAAANPQAEELDSETVAALSTFAGTPLAPAARAMAEKRRSAYQEALVSQLSAHLRNLYS